MSRAAGVLHVSVDDVLEALLEAAESPRRPSSGPLLAPLAALHRACGVPVDAYVFLAGAVAGRRRALSELPDRALAPLVAEGWLRLGPHARDPDHRLFDEPAVAGRSFLAEADRELRRLTGCGSSTPWLRLHLFAEALELDPELRRIGVETLLLTDREAVAYTLDGERRSRLAREGRLTVGGLTLRRSHLRVEHLAGSPPVELRRRAASWVERHGYLTVFTHECELRRPEVVRALRVLVEAGLELGLRPPAGPDQRPQ